MGEEEEVEDMEEVTELEEEAIVVTEVEDMEEAMVVATIMTDTMVVVTIQKEVREVEDTIPREAAEALLIKNLVIAVIGTSILAIARKNANECGNIVVVLFQTSGFYEEISQSLYFLGTVVNVFYITYTSFNSHKFYYDTIRFSFDLLLRSIFSHISDTYL